jgi:hypothetical protein
MPAMWSLSLRTCIFLGHQTRDILSIAMQYSLLLMTKNHNDFLDLHEVVQTAEGSHPGILIIRLDNDPNRDMTPRQIVAAISHLESARVPLQNQVYILNHWR